MGMIDNALALRRVMKDARRPRAELNVLIEKRLHRIFISAKNVPYYRDYMKSIHYDPQTDYEGVSDLKRFPILKKTFLKENGQDQFLNENYDKTKMFTDMTSGSTGIPITVWREPKARALQLACWMRVLFFNNYSVFDKILSFTSPARLNEGKSLLQQFGVLRRLAVDYNATPAEHLDQVLQYRPSILYGNRSSFDLLMLEMEKRGITIDWIKLILASGETITDQVRRNCEKYFGIPLTQWYGSVEGINAYETPERDGLHLSDDLKYYEFVNDKGEEAKPGEVARIIVSTLYEEAMPLIRYEQGDSVIFKEVETPNGEKVRRIERVIGRQDDKARLSDGRIIPFLEIYEIFDKYSGLRQYRVIQKKIDLFHVILAADASYVDEIKQRLGADLEILLQSAARYEIEQVDELPLDPTGKLRTLISEIS